MPLDNRQQSGADQTPAPPTYEKFLSACSFRGIAIPNGGWESGFSQSHVVHKPVDRDGAYVESTGRDPYTFSITAPFMNHWFPGQTEGWTYGNLFPFQYNLVRAACVDRSIGTLVHPAWGSFDAKCIDWKESLDPQKRSGIVVSISFIETIKPTFDTLNVSVDPGAVAQSYDAEVTRLNLPPDPNLPDKKSLFDLVTDLKAAIDGGSLQVTQAIAKANRILYQVDRIEQSLSQAKSNDTAAARNLGERLKETVYAIRLSLNESAASSIRRYQAPRDMTMLSLVQRLDNDVATLIKLNPFLVGSAVIKEGTFLRFRAVS